MIKLNKNYYITLNSRKELVARFTNKEDAYAVLPEIVPCFGRNFRDGYVYYVDDEFLDLFAPNSNILVFENVDEYYNYNNQDELSL